MRPPRARATARARVSVTQRVPGRQPRRARDRRTPRRDPGGETVEAHGLDQTRGLGLLRLQRGHLATQRVRVEREPESSLPRARRCGAGRGRRPRSRCRARDRRGPARWPRRAATGAPRGIGRAHWSTHRLTVRWSGCPVNPSGPKVSTVSGRTSSIRSASRRTAGSGSASAHPTVLVAEPVVLDDTEQRQRLGRAPPCGAAPSRRRAAGVGSAPPGLTAGGGHGDHPVAARHQARGEATAQVGLVVGVGPDEQGGAHRARSVIGHGSILDPPHCHGAVTGCRIGGSPVTSPCQHLPSRWISTMDRRVRREREEQHDHHEGVDRLVRPSSDRRDRHRRGEGRGVRGQDRPRPRHRPQHAARLPG